MSGGCRELRNLGRFLGWARWGASSLQDAPQFGPLRQSGSASVESMGVLKEVPGVQERRQQLAVGEAVGESSRKFQGGANMQGR